MNILPKLVNQVYELFEKMPARFLVGLSICIVLKTLALFGLCSSYTV